MPEQKPGKSGRPDPVLMRSWNTFRTHAGTAVRKDCMSVSHGKASMSSFLQTEPEITKLPRHTHCFDYLLQEQKSRTYPTFVACEQHRPFVKETTTKRFTVKFQGTCEVWMTTLECLRVAQDHHGIFQFKEHHGIYTWEILGNWYSRGFHYSLLSSLQRGLRAFLVLPPGSWHKITSAVL